MWFTYLICLVIVIAIEMGAYKFIGRPFFQPLLLKLKHSTKYLGRKKKQKMYDIRKDFDHKDIESSSDEDEKKSERKDVKKAMSWKF